MVVMCSRSDIWPRFWLPSRPPGPGETLAGQANLAPNWRGRGFESCWGHYLQTRGGLRSNLSSVTSNAASGMGRRGHTLSILRWLACPVKSGPES